MLWHVGLLSGSLLLVFPLMRHQVFSVLETRVSGYVSNELKDFRDLQAGQLTPIQQENVQHYLATHTDLAPFNPHPQDFAEAKTLLRIFFADRVPEDGIFLVGMVNGQLYRSLPRALPEALQPGQPVFEGLRQIKEEASGPIRVTAQQSGRFFYHIEPIQADDRLLGRLVIVRSVDAEEKQALEVLSAAGQAIGVVAVLVLVVGWYFMGKTLKPLKALNTSLWHVRAFDLSQRIPIQGKGELADLSLTFNHMMERLELAFQSQRDLLNDVGHQLRTPITIIRGHLELMDHDPHEIQATQALVMDELDRMSRLVNELILLAQSEHPNFLHLETIAIPGFMTDLLAKVKVLATRNWCIDEVAAGDIIADRQRLTEAVCNLVENAIRHTDTADTIALGARREGDQFYLWVRDTRAGIHNADQERIFERFVRSSNQPRSDGAGLGLAIVKAIAKAHGGAVKLESTLGHGAKFTIIVLSRGILNT